MNALEEFDLNTDDLIWVDASSCKKSIIGANAEPPLPPSGARPDLPAYRVVTDERPWRPQDGGR